MFTNTRPKKCYRDLFVFANCGAYVAPASFSWCWFVLACSMVERWPTCVVHSSTVNCAAWFGRCKRSWFDSRPAHFINWSAVTHYSSWNRQIARTRRDRLLAFAQKRLLLQLTELVSFENGIHDSAPRLNVEGIVGGRALSTTIEFDAVSCSVMENCGSVKVAVVRSGDTSREAQVR